MSIKAELNADPTALEGFLEDESGFRGHAEGLIRARDAAHVAQVLAEATAAGVAVTFSARRTSLTGAAIPEGGWVVAVNEASSPELVRVDIDAREATAPAGVLMVDVERAVEAAGLFLPPDPTSRKECSIGGAVICNASGARSFGHGPIGEWVTALEIVLATGERLRLRRGEHPPIDGNFYLRLGERTVTIPVPDARPEGLKSSLGYQVYPTPDLIDLFIGSEGTLGYVSEVTVRLIERQPIFAALVFWDAVGPALEFVERLQLDPPSGLDPMSVEWFDARALALAGARYPRFGVPKTAVAALFLEQRHPAGAEDAVAMAWYEALLDAGAPDDEAALRIPRSPADLDAFRDFRHAVPESVNHLARGNGQRKIGTDLAWPRGTLAHMAARYDYAVAHVPELLGPAGVEAHIQRWGQPPPQRLDTACFGHIGDNHLHLNLLPKTDAEADAAHRLYFVLAQECIAAGGSVSGEHGIGKAKRALLGLALSDAQIETMRAIKRVLDPAQILGRGNLFSAETG